MPKCPHCKEDIESLICYSDEIIKFNTYLIGNKEQYLQYEEIDAIPKGSRDEFCCPECEEPIAHGHIDAKEFLLGIGGDNSESE